MDVYGFLMDVDGCVVHVLATELSNGSGQATRKRRSNEVGHGSKHVKTRLTLRYTKMVYKILNKKVVVFET